MRWEKTFLIDIIYKVISTDYKKALKMLKSKVIYFSEEDGCFLFNENGFHSATHLKSIQEEGNSKVILHCMHALKEPEATVVLRSPFRDTDIMALAVRWFLQVKIEYLSIMETEKIVKQSS